MTHSPGGFTGSLQVLPLCTEHPERELRIRVWVMFGRGPTFQISPDLRCLSFRETNLRYTGGAGEGSSQKWKHPKSGAILRWGDLAVSLGLNRQAWEPSTDKAVHREQDRLPSLTES